MARRHFFNSTRKQVLLVTELLDVSRSAATAVGQLHRGNDEGAEFIHVDDGNHFLGGGLTTWHLHLEKNKEILTMETAQQEQDSRYILFLLAARRKKGVNSAAF